MLEAYPDCPCATRERLEEKHDNDCALPSRAAKLRSIATDAHAEQQLLRDLLHQALRTRSSPVSSARWRKAAREALA